MDKSTFLEENAGKSKHGHKSPLHGKEGNVHDTGIIPQDKGNIDGVEEYKSRNPFQGNTEDLTAFDIESRHIHVDTMRNEISERHCREHD